MPSIREQQRAHLLRWTGLHAWKVGPAEMRCDTHVSRSVYRFPIHAQTGQFPL